MPPGRVPLQQVGTLFGRISSVACGEAIEVGANGRSEKEGKECRWSHALTMALDVRGLQSVVGAGVSVEGAVLRGVGANGICRCSSASGAASPIYTAWRFCFNKYGRESHQINWFICIQVAHTGDPIPVRQHLEMMLRLSHGWRQTI